MVDCFRGCKPESKSGPAGFRRSHSNKHRNPRRTLHHGVNDRTPIYCVHEHYRQTRVVRLVRGGKECHGGTIVRSETRRAVRTNGNSNLRRSVNDDRATDNTALTSTCAKLLAVGLGKRVCLQNRTGFASARDIVVTDSDEFQW